MPDPKDARLAVLAIKDRIIEQFKVQDWRELGILTDTTDLITNHARLLRSLGWGDPDYPDNALEMLLSIVARDPGNVESIRGYVATKFGEGGVNVSSVEVPGPKIYFTPSVFVSPATLPEPDLLSVMMPFGASFRPVYAAIQQVAEYNQMRCFRADDIWNHSTIIQDIFSLIFRSFIVVCDFTGKNPNVFYEAGIAHALGKHVIPITQERGDIPFDLQAHRYIHYLPNSEGIIAMQDILSSRIATLLG
jgi:hypothetical protein